jgi:hypothetical protein
MGCSGWSNHERVLQEHCISINSFGALLGLTVEVAHNIQREVLSREVKFVESINVKTACIAVVQICILLFLISPGKTSLSGLGALTRTIDASLS